MSKFYAVFGGSDCLFAVYNTWDQTNRAVKGRKGCKFKRFGSMNLCLQYLKVDITNPDLKIFQEELTFKKRKRQDMVLEVSTDGGCINNGADNAKASCGVFFGIKDPRNIGFMLPGTLQTNNRSEILSATLGVLALDEGTVFTDSMYTIASVERAKKWISNTDTSITPMVNYDLIHLLVIALQHRPKVVLKHVKAHHGDLNNEGADAICTSVLKGKHLI
jgi:ribonuclease HI